MEKTRNRKRLHITYRGIERKDTIMQNGNGIVPGERPRKKMVNHGNLVVQITRKLVKDVKYTLARRKILGVLYTTVGWGGGAQTTSEIKRSCRKEKGSGCGF